MELLELLHWLLHDYIFLIPLVVLVLTELAKLAVEWWKTGSWHEKLFHPGGMPSSHSAFVMSLVMIVGYKTGIQSVEFTIAFVFACITWYDAISSRRAIGVQAALLNRLQKWQKLTEQLGHSLPEVAVGILFGAVVTGIGIWLS